MKNFLTALTATVVLAGLAPVQPAEATLPPCPRGGVLVNSGDLDVLVRVARAFPSARYCSVQGGKVKQIFATADKSKLQKVAKVAQQQVYIYQ